MYRFKEVEQAHVAVAFDSISSNSDDSIPFKVANIVFGGGMSSRLFQKIREEHGLAYTVYSSLSAYANNGYLELYLGTSPKNVQNAVDLLIDEILRLKKHGITNEEMERAKTQVKTSLVFGCENPLGLMISYGICYLLFDKSFDIESKINQVDKVDLNYATKCLVESLDFNKCSAVFVGKKCDDYIYPKSFIGWQNK